MSREALGAFEAALQPALEAYGAALDEHGHARREAIPDEDTLEATLERIAENRRGLCICGWEPKAGVRAPSRALGIHITAARKRASKIYELEAARIAEDLRRCRCLVGGVGTDETRRSCPVHAQG